jgi:hypothetical protein
MRLFSIGAAALCLGLLACGPKGQTEAAKPAAAPGAFPRPTAAYVAHYKIYDSEGGSRDMTIYADAGRVRAETAPPIKGSTMTMATILDPASKHMISFRTGPDAPKVAMTMSPDKLGEAGKFFDPDQGRPGATVIGSDNVAGQSCRVWQIPSATEGGEAQVTCVTDDGIMLRTGKQSTPAKPMMEAVSVQRGGQDPALFAAPAGYEIVDYGPCLALTQDAMAAMKAGKKPDMVKMKQCQALGEKLGGMFKGQ